MNRNRTVVINEIISELEKITGDVNIKKIRDELEFASLELEVAAPDESIKPVSYTHLTLPTILRV